MCNSVPIRIVLHFAHPTDLLDGNTATINCKKCAIMHGQYSRTYKIEFTILKDFDILSEDIIT